MVTSGPMIRRRVHLAIAVLLALGAAWALIFTLASTTNATPAQPSAAAPAEACAGLTDTALAECDALVRIYTDTQGSTWFTDDNWLSTTPGITLCDWYGVTCENGHVTRLELPRNRLTGRLPAAIGDLKALTHLSVDGNRLRGLIPPALCSLRNSLVNVDLGYNALYTFNSRIRQCLNQLDPDWAATQTAPPRRVEISAITTDTITLTWDPILYTGDGGYYEIGYSSTLTGAWAIHGKTADKNATGYTLDNLLPGETVFVEVWSVTPAHDANPTPVTSERVLRMAVTAADETILLIVYAAFDNDLSEYGIDIVDRLRTGTAVNPNVRAVVLVDRRGEENSDIVIVENGQVQRTSAVEDRWGVAEVDTADPDVLAWFLTYARSTYPATRTFVSIIGHGVGPAPEIEIEQPSTRAKAPPLPQGQEYTPGDVTSLTYMSTVELGRALAQATDNGANPFDLIFFDQCFQGNLDTLYEIRQAAQIFIASPNYAWLSAPYARYVSMMAPAASTESIASAMLNIYQISLDNTHPNAIFWVSRSLIEDLASALDDLALALGKALNGGRSGQILNAAQDARHADTTQCGDHRYVLAPPDELIGLGRFALNLRAAFPSGDPAGVHAAADAVIVYMAGVQRAYRIGHPYIAPDEFWDYDDALTILAPLRRDAPSAVAWRASLYTQTAPMTATWSVDTSQILTIPTSLALTRDGLWDDFLAAWYTNLGTPTVGQWCNYTPPARVLDENADVISLTVTAEDDSSVRLTWDATGDESAEGYWLFARRPTDLDWVLQATFPLTQTSSIQTDLTANASYRYLVLARNADRIFVARSNDITWTQPAEIQMLFLPTVVKNE
jgi:hypothetical protein